MKRKIVVDRTDLSISRFVTNEFFTIECNTIARVFKGLSFDAKIVHESWYGAMAGPYKYVCYLVMCIMKTFHITYHDSSYSRYEYISQYSSKYLAVHINILHYIN